MLQQIKNSMMLFVVAGFWCIPTLCAGRPSKRLKKQEAHEQLILAEREAEALRTQRLIHKRERQEVKRVLDAQYGHAKQLEGIWSENLQDIEPYVDTLVVYTVDSYCLGKDMHKDHSNNASVYYGYLLPDIDSDTSNRLDGFKQLLKKAKVYSIPAFRFFLFSKPIRMRAATTQEAKIILHTLASDQVEFSAVYHHLNSGNLVEIMTFFMTSKDDI